MSDKNNRLPLLAWPPGPDIRQPRKLKLLPTACGKVSHTWPGIQLWLAFGAQLLWSARTYAEDRADYVFGYYKEDNSRMTIVTHSAFFEQKLTDTVTAKGEFTYDGVSGTTPTGTLNGNQINTVHLEDLRRGENLEADWQVGNHALNPSFAHSLESDYQSYGMALSDAFAFNEKNTILQYGISQNLDEVRESDRKTWQKKFSTEGIIGVSQLLSPNDIMGVACTLGNDSGFLSDPYRQQNYVSTFPVLPFSVGVPERRPSHRNKEVLMISETHYFEANNASLEGSYRFYHDSYGVYASTLALNWHQWIGKHLIVEPFIRLYEQSAADFYYTTISGPLTADAPGFHSSDYRLSKLYTLDTGFLATVVVTQNVRLVAGFHRYEMNGLDGQTNPEMYPRANVYSLGCTILW